MHWQQICAASRPSISLLPPSFVASPRSCLKFLPASNIRLSLSTNHHCLSLSICLSPNSGLSPISASLILDFYLPPISASLWPPISASLWPPISSSVFSSWMAILYLPCLSLFYCYFPLYLSPSPSLLLLPLPFTYHNSFPLYSSLLNSLSLHIDFIACVPHISTESRCNFQWPWVK